MKKITFLFLFLFAGFSAFAQFPESFEGATFPPAGWASFRGTNGIGTVQDWKTITPAPATVGLVGTKTAYVEYENVTGGLAQDWLVTPLVTITAANPNLTFADAQQFTIDYGTTYEVRVSTTSQTNIAGFTTVNSRTEANLSLLGTAGLTSQTVDLSAYIGQSVYIAFVMTNDDGDNWFLENVNAGSPVTACLSNAFMFPDTAVTPGACDGFTPTLVSNFSYAGDYFEVNVTSGQTYTFNSSAPDFLTISTDGNFTAAAFGVAPLTWVSTVTGVVRVNINTDSATCGTEDFDRTTTVTCGVVCLNTAFTSPYPSATYTPTTCDGLTVNNIDAFCYAGEYSNVNVFNTSQYTFSSSTATDYITITSADASTIYAVGTGSVIWTSEANQVVRFYTHTNSDCGTENQNRTRSVVCTTTVSLPNCIDTPPVYPLDGANNIPAFSDVVLAWNPPSTGDAPSSYNIYVGFTPNSLSLAGNVGNVTSANAGAVGAYDTTIYWLAVPVNAAGEAIGCTATEWSFTTESAPLPPVNDDCVGALTLTPGNNFNTNPVIVNNGGATDSGQAPSDCTPTVSPDVWYSVVVPASGSLTFETNVTEGSITDTVVIAYTGTCGSLTEIGCNDDIDFDGGNFLSLFQVTGLPAGTVVYLRFYTYGEIGTALLSAYDASLASSNFDNASFVASPNPVKDVLNISYAQNIEKVQVLNILGQEVISKSLNATQSQIDMSNLAVGTYLVKVTADGLVKTIKVIKE